MNALFVTDLALCIFSFLDSRTLLKIQRTCRTWSKLIVNDLLEKYKKTYALPLSNHHFVQSTISKSLPEIQFDNAAFSKLFSRWTKCFPTPKFVGNALFGEYNRNQTVPVLLELTAAAERITSCFSLVAILSNNTVFLLDISSFELVIAPWSESKPITTLYLFASPQENQDAVVSKYILLLQHGYGSLRQYSITVDNNSSVNNNTKTLVREIQTEEELTHVHFEAFTSTLLLSYQRRAVAIALNNNAETTTVHESKAISSKSRYLLHIVGYDQASSKIVLVLSQIATTSEGRSHELYKYAILADYDTKRCSISNYGKAHLLATQELTMFKHLQVVEDGFSFIGRYDNNDHDILRIYNVMNEESWSRTRIKYDDKYHVYPDFYMTKFHGQRGRMALCGELDGECFTIRRIENSECDFKAYVADETGVDDDSDVHVLYNQVILVHGTESHKLYIITRGIH